jgi:DNA-binding transcriptional LysR family regulator
VGLTEAGSAYFGRCESLLAELESAEAEASALGEELRGRLRISAATGLGMVQLVPALPEFLAKHPRLTVDLDLSNRYVDLVEERFDVAIRVGELRDSRLVARRLGPNRRILAGVGRVRHVLPAWSTQEQGIYAIYPGHRFIPAKVSAFVDYFAQWLRAQARGKA